MIGTYYSQSPGVWTEGGFCATWSRWCAVVGPPSRVLLRPDLDVAIVQLLVALEYSTVGVRRRTADVDGLCVSLYASRTVSSLKYMDNLLHINWTIEIVILTKFNVYNGLFLPWTRHAHLRRMIYCIWIKSWISTNVFRILSVEYSVSYVNFYTNVLYIDVLIHLI